MQRCGAAQVGIAMARISFSFAYVDFGSILRDLTFCDFYGGICLQMPSRLGVELLGLTMELSFLGGHFGGSPVKSCDLGVHSVSRGFAGKGGGSMAQTWLQ